MVLKSIPKKDGELDVFETSVQDGVLQIKGSSGVAQCRAFYDFVKSQNGGMFSWSGIRYELAEKMPDTPARKVVSPFGLHYYFNTCTYGYTMPYWDWARWEKEIDWMALHGVNLPLALVANEAISRRVWLKLGLTEKEIDAYFTGPAHLPWMRMGNMCGQDGGLPIEWHKGQVSLQHKILKKLKALGMNPVCPGFAGFVPKEMSRLFPNMKLIEAKWVGGFKNWIVSPDDSTFAKIGKMFIEEWEKEFGKNKHYLIDTFNEIEIPLPENGKPERYTLFNQFGQNVYKGLKEANPDAIWVMQGWMFGYQRHIWDYETTKALLEKVPDDKMLILDLAVDYNKLVWGHGANHDFYKGMFNKPWIYSVIPNMGGRTVFGCPLEFYAKGHFDSLRSPIKERLAGYGTAPEGIENNEMAFELIMDAGWSDKPIDLKNWYKQYSMNRYGKCPEALNAVWDNLQKSVYSSIRGGTFGWQFRPGSSIRNRVGEEFFKGVESFSALSGELGDSPLYKTDLIEMSALYAGFKVDLLTEHIEKAYLYQNQEKAAEYEKLLIEVLTQMDSLLALHPTLRFDIWIANARKHGSTEELKNAYEKNARRIVTTWGPSLDEYSARVWAGLIRDYYLPRWKHYCESLRTKQPFNFDAWEQNWVEKEHGLSQPVPCKDIIQGCLDLIQQTKKIQTFQSNSIKGEIIGSWTPETISTEEKEMVWNFPISKVKEATGVCFSFIRGKHMLCISEVTLELDGKDVCTVKQMGSTGSHNNNNYYRLALSSDIIGNNSCRIRAKVRTEGGNDSTGEVKVILRNAH